MTPATAAMPAPAAAPLPAVRVPVVRRLGRRDYLPTWQSMKDFTAGRGADTTDEFWVVEHPPVYTVGIAGRPEHFPRTDSVIPIVRTDRGGQITYHGPGQIVVYTLLDLRRLGLSVRALVRTLEDGVIGLLADHGLAARGDVDRPGVYVGTAKIAALGLKVRGGCCYHGLSLNVDMDLSPFGPIDPCGYPGLAVTDLLREGVAVDRDTLAEELVQNLMERLHG